MSQYKFRWQLNAREIINQMDPYEKFNRCIRILRISTQLIRRNIFESKSEPSAIFALIVFFFTINILGGIYTAKYYDQTTAFTAALMAIGLSQVRDCRPGFSFFFSAFSPE